MALFSRLIRTWHSRTGSPRRSCGDVGGDERNQLQTLVLRLCDYHTQRPLRHLRYVEVEGFDRQLPGLDLREVQNVVNDRQQGAAAGADCLGELALFRGEVSVDEQVGQAHHAVHWCPDLVAHRGKKFRLGTVGRFRRFFGCRKLLICDTQLSVHLLKLARPQFKLLLKALVFPQQSVRVGPLA